MAPPELLSRLRIAGITLTAEGGELCLKAPAGALTAELRGEVIAQKVNILDYLRHAEITASSPQPPITPTARGKNASLSFPQERLWFLDQLEPNRAIYNIPLAWRLEGQLDVPSLLKALNHIVQRHEALRTRFEAVEGRSVQVIESSASLEIPVIDLTSLPQQQREAEAMRLCGDDAQRPFDLKLDLMLRARLFRLGPTDHILYLNMHHIASDGWSVGVLLAELGALYTAFVEGKPSPLAELPIQYADYAVWQREWLQGEVLETQLSYWRKQLEGAPTSLRLPTDRPRPAVQSYRGALLRGELPEALTAALKELSRDQGVTLFMTLLAAFQTLLHRYTGGSEILVGSPIAGRQHTELEPLIGFFVNTLVFRGDLSDDPSFRTLLGRTRDVALGAYAHQDLPFEKLVEELHPERDMSHAPIFQVLFALQNAPLEAAVLPGLEVTPVALDSGVSKFDLSLMLREREGSLRTIVEYSTDLFDAGTIGRMMGHYQTLLEGIVSNPDQRVWELPLLTQSERHEILVDWNRTEVAYPKDRCVHELIEEQVERTPDATAVVFEDTHLTYRQLNGRANQLAHHLQKLGVGPDVLVGICVERSLEMVIGLLGILKAGGTYVPLDPEYPKDRLAFMLQDSQVAVLLTQTRLVELVAPCPLRIIRLDADWPSIDANSIAKVNSSVEAHHLAYMIYTSGSTGRPKGAMNTHVGIVNRLLWMQDAHRLTSADRILQKTPFSFDVSVWEFFWPLLTGAGLVLARPGGHRDTTYLAGIIRQEAITTLHFVPSMLGAFLEQDGLESSCGSVKRVICSGEALPFETQERFFSRLPAQLHNLYGPTEAAVDVTCWACRRETQSRTVPIGRPIANTQIYILDRHLHPVPVGVAGELHIGGIGLARGYHNRPELTKEKFIPNPFTSGPASCLYKTGDMARHLPDGNIEFLGRLDNQVKIRGFRIELGEIESVLARHPAVREAVVAVREDVPGDKRMVAYLTAMNGHAPTASELRGLLQARVPEYMVPSAFITLDVLPLTPNGKVDRKALPAPEDTDFRAEDSHVGPRTEMEEAIAGIWREVLGIQGIGIKHSFFDLGGHSLLAMRVISKVRDVFGVNVPLRALFDSPTVEGMAAALLRLSAKPPSIIRRRTAASNSVPLSFAQERLWFLDQLEPNRAVYNIPMALRLGGALDVPSLLKALNYIVQRHEALRTRFEAVEGRSVQVIEPSALLEMPLVDLDSLPQQQREAEAMRLCGDDARRPFDLKCQLMLRATLFRLGPADHILCLNMHHIASDGWSVGVLFAELRALYTAFVEGKPSPLAELPIQYADYALWQREWLQGEVLEKQLSYWRKQLERAQTLVNLPADRPRPAVQSYRGALLRGELPEALTAALKELSRAEGVTLFMTLLAAFQTLLHRYTGGSEILVGSPIAGRQHTELEPLIGFFVNTLVFRGDLSDDPSFRTLLGRTRDVALGAYAHQDLPFEKLVEELHPQRDMSHAPIFQVLFALQNAPVEAAALPGLEVTPVALDSGVSKFDLSLMVREGQGALRTVVEYSTDLFDAPTIVRMTGHYQTLLEGIVSNPDQRLSDLPLLSENERRQILVDWNRTEVANLEDRCLHELIEDQVKRTPDAVAVVFESTHLTYRQLNDRANELAHHLQRLGVGPNTLVAIFMERSLDMVVGLLGILKAGGAYVPLDPEYPEQRLAFVVEDARPLVLLTLEAMRPRLPRHQAQVVCLDALPAREMPAKGLRSVVDKPQASDLAYVLYTSGSTGTPKGVQISHRAFVNFLDSMRREPGMDAQDTLLAVTTLSFDIAGLELFLPLTTGARVVIASDEMAWDAAQLLSLMKRCAVTVMQATPATWRMLLAAGWQGSPGLKILCGGEAWSTDLANELLPRCESLWNMYGPTETTVWSSVARVEEGKPVLIGPPIANTTFYILDSHRQPAPVGIPGELHIGGVGLARAYHNRAELTAEKFIADPFSVEPGARLYRTGDLARYLPDGNIEFLGRLDHQVKIRGFRIELGEIESLLTQHPGVQTSAVVVARQDTAGDHRLAAYIVSRNGALPASDLREYLRSKVPEYMVPAAFVAMKELPLTPNGKVDRKALPAPDVGELGDDRGYLAPQTPTEETLAGIWRDLLGLKQVGIRDNFFDLGGHSLLAIRMASRVQDAFLVDLPLQMLFENPTISSLAARIETLLWAGNDVTPRSPAAFVEGEV